MLPRLRTISGRRWRRQVLGVVRARGVGCGGRVIYPASWHVENSCFRAVNLPVHGGSH